MKQWIGLFVAFLTIMVGCSAQPPQTSKPGPMEPVASGQWPVLADDLDPESLGRALEQSRVYLKRLPADRLFQYGPDRYTAGHLLKSLDTFEKYFVKFSPDPEFQRLMERDFILYRSIGRDSQGEILVTGYYEPELRGAKSPSERFRWPIYGLPHDLVTVDLGEFRSEWAGQKIYGRLVGNKLFPYFSRHDIDSRWALAGRGLELGLGGRSGLSFLFAYPGIGAGEPAGRPGYPARLCRCKRSGLPEPGAENDRFRFAGSRRRDHANHAGLASGPSGTGDGLVGTQRKLCFFPGARRRCGGQYQCLPDTGEKCGPGPQNISKRGAGPFWKPACRFLPEPR